MKLLTFLIWALLYVYTPAPLPSGLQYKAPVVTLSARAARRLKK